MSSLPGKRAASTIRAAITAGRADAALWGTKHAAADHGLRPHFAEHRPERLRPARREAFLTAYELAYGDALARLHGALSIEAHRGRARQQDENVTAHLGAYSAGAPR